MRTAGPVGASSSAVGDVTLVSRSMWVAIDWVRDGRLLLSIVLCQSKRVFCRRVRHDIHSRGALLLHLGDGVSAIWL